MSIFGSLRKAGIDYQQTGGLHISKQLVLEAGLAMQMGKGKVFYLDPANGSDNNSGKSPTKAFATLATAYAALTSGQHDTLVMIGSGTTATITDTLTWSKNLTHLIGVGAPAPNSRARITVSGTDSAVAGLAVSGYGCVFSNIRVYQSTSLAACGAISVSGNRNYFYNVDIQGQAGANAASSATAYNLLLNGAEECRFERCNIGLDTVKKTDGAVLRLDGGAARNEFIECIFKSWCETAAKAPVRYADANALDRYLLFRDCLFYNFYENHGGNLTEAFTVPANCATHDVILQNCWLAGITEWDSNDRGHMWIGSSVPTAATAGIMVEPAT